MNSKKISVSIKCDWIGMMAAVITSHEGAYSSQAIPDRTYVRYSNNTSIKRTRCGSIECRVKPKPVNCRLYVCQESHMQWILEWSLVQWYPISQAPKHLGYIGSAVHTRDMA